MFYAGVVVCTTICQIVFSYPGVIAFDDCLTALAEYNEKIRKYQIAPKMTGSTLFYNSGCLEIKTTTTMTEDSVKNAVFKKFGPAAYVPDKNIRRILKRQYYDQPPVPEHFSTRGSWKTLLKKQR